MAFNVAYHDLLDKNIRHIYSSLPANVRFRSEPQPGVTLKPHDGCMTPSNKRRSEAKPMLPSLYRRLWAYSPEYDCVLPRAPALRSVSPDKAQLIVNRVYHATHRRRRNHNRDDVTTSSDVSSGRFTPLSCSSRGTTGTTGTEDRNSARTSTAGTSIRSEWSRDEEEEEEERVLAHLMRPTVAWNIRSDLREGSVLDPVKVVHHRVTSRQSAKSAHQ